MTRDELGGDAGGEAGGDVGGEAGGEAGGDVGGDVVVVVGGGDTGTGGEGFVGCVGKSKGRTS